MTFRFQIKKFKQITSWKPEHRFEETMQDLLNALEGKGK